jgi:hypothetical protein
MLPHSSQQRLKNTCLTGTFHNSMEVNINTCLLHVFTVFVPSLFCATGTGCACSCPSSRNLTRSTLSARVCRREMNIVLQGLEQHFWKGTEAGRMGCYDFPGETWAGWIGKQRRYGARSVCFQRPGRNLEVREGREEEGVSSLRPELAVIARTLQATSLEVDLLY